ncbi:MAG TPA: hypothetical protein VF516_02870, partial [Kofleriaceae bacterium]
MRTAIASDAELYIAREDARDAADQVALARSVFLPRLSGEIAGTRNAQPPSATSFAAIDAIAAATLGISGRIDTGMTYSVSAGITRQDRDDPFAKTYDVATTTAVRAEIVQPLRRGAFAA